MDRKSNLLFNLIAPIYGLFYEYQKKHYDAIVDSYPGELRLTSYKNVIDIGCGTGALCSVLNEKGLSVTGVDSAVNMLNIAKSKLENEAVSFVQGDIVGGLPFETKSFDISIASYVAHGLKEDERKRMYAEMSRLTKHWVIIYDYNKKSSLLTKIAEWLERGDYFNFIKRAEYEMKSCFSEVKVINVNVRAAWYICKPV